PDTLVDVSNGRLRKRTIHPDGTMTYDWFVNDPINNYDVAVNAGKYVHFMEMYNGLKGPLTLDYYVMPYHLEQAERQFQQAKSMLKCYEYWFGPYPWYKDGYKLVEDPYLGMEHQSCIAYGNHYEDGYLGRDLSHTGWGLKWDFIIIHESAHEWFGNSITAKDIADMWVHESFANYAESLYTEFLFGKKAGEEYCAGTRKNVLNDKPIVGYYGVNDEGSGDMYYKGGNMLLAIRTIINSDEKFRDILHGLNATFYHQTVTGKQIEDYISKASGIDFSKVFQQYLTTTMIPEFDYYIKGHELHYRWSNVVTDFNMPLKVTLERDKFSFIYPTEEWKAVKISSEPANQFKVDNHFYVNVKSVKS
ncbi:MAG: M1 family peptidase, partial [Chitinophagaceae bacterium]